MRPRKRFGQHFLEPAWVRKVIDAIQPAPDDCFLEVGPGRGALTLALAPRVRRLIAIEVDRDLAADLRTIAPANVEVVIGDVLAADLAMAGEPVRVAGNLPYNISSPILFRLLRAHLDGRRIVDATLMLQREVADRLVAAPGSGDYGVLSVLVQLHADISRVLTLPPGAFRPPPAVTSSLIRMTFRPPRVALASPALFEEMVRAVFVQRRKTVGNALKPFATRQGPLRAGDALSAARIDPGRRPETLQLQEFAALADVFAAAPQ